MNSPEDKDIGSLGRSIPWESIDPDDTLGKYSAPAKGKAEAAPSKSPEDTPAEQAPAPEEPSKSSPQSELFDLSPLQDYSDRKKSIEPIATTPGQPDFPVPDEPVAPALSQIADEHPAPPVEAVEMVSVENTAEVPVEPETAFEEPWPAATSISNEVETASAIVSEDIQAAEVAHNDLHADVEAVSQDDVAHVSAASLSANNTPEIPAPDEPPLRFAFVAAASEQDEPSISQTEPLEVQPATATATVQPETPERNLNKPLVVADISNVATSSSSGFPAGWVYSPTATANDDDEPAPTSNEIPHATNESLPLSPAPLDPSGKSQTDGGGWTVTLLCVGLALCAACIIIPQADANRRLAYDGKQLSVDLDQIQKQVAVNKEFLQKIQSDPQLAERLAQRQMNLIRQGETVLDVAPQGETPGLTPHGQASHDAQRMSPFSITTVAPPPPLPAYQPTGGEFVELCREPRPRLYILGAALFMVAAGLVLGTTAKVESAS